MDGRVVRDVAIAVACVVLVLLAVFAVAGMGPPKVIEVPPASGAGAVRIESTAPFAR